MPNISGDLELNIRSPCSSTICLPLAIAISAAVSSAGKPIGSDEFVLLEDAVRLSFEITPQV